MDANLNFLTAPPANTTQIAGFSGTSAVDPTLSKPMNGKEFAGLMRDLMPQSERQELAGLPDPTGRASHPQKTAQSRALIGTGLKPNKPWKTPQTGG